MARVKLTERYIATMPLPAGHDRIDRDTDTTGLAVRITESGARSFLFCYHFDGRERRLPLGPWAPRVSVRLGEDATRKAGGSLEWARQEVARLRLKVRAGTNPAAEKEAARQQRESARQQAAKEISFEGLAGRYLEEYAKPNKRSWKEDERRINAYIIPAWGKRKVKDMTRADVDALISPLVTAGLKAEAVQRLALVRVMFSFAMDKSIIDSHPCLRMKAAKVKPAPRTRALTTAEELKQFWAMTGGEDWAEVIPADEADALRLLLWTGARVSEVAELPWSEVDLAEGTWLLPAARSKNKRANLVPLLPDALAMLKRRRKAVEGDYVFPTKRTPYMKKGSLSRPVKAACDDLPRRELKLAPFTPHDLRRTVETGMAAAKVPKEYRDRVLNHVDASVGGQHYNMHDYYDEKREALEKWDRRLQSMLSGESAKVVPIRRGRA